MIASEFTEIRFWISDRWLAPEIRLLGSRRCLVFVILNLKIMNLKMVWYLNICRKKILIYQASFPYSCFAALDYSIPFGFFSFFSSNICFSNSRSSFCQFCTFCSDFSLETLLIGFPWVMVGFARRFDRGSPPSYTRLDGMAGETFMLTWLLLDGSGGLSM